MFAWVTLRFASPQLFVLVPILVWQVVTQRASRHIIAWFVGGLFTAFAVLISMNDGASQMLLLRAKSHSLDVNPPCCSRRTPRPVHPAEVPASHYPHPLHGTVFAFIRDVFLFPRRCCAGVGTHRSFRTASEFEQ